MTPARTFFMLVGLSAGSMIGTSTAIYLRDREESIRHEERERCELLRRRDRESWERTQATRDEIAAIFSRNGLPPPTWRSR